MIKLGVVSALAVGLLGATAAVPANAGTGCNGVINPFIWGCAPWDNNNGPQFPYYKKTRISVPRDKGKIETHNGVQMVRDVRNNRLMPLIGMDGSTMVAAGGGN